jgi:hypothetical protein
LLGKGGVTGKIVLVPQRVMATAACSGRRL